ncbi:hypothetical protein C8F01DRAFT_1110510 [Mycena amicta]|nr:hypothetical protein C8F01DRAFT_1110510 [Mycena amicta]
MSTPKLFIMLAFVVGLAFAVPTPSQDVLNNDSVLPPTHQRDARQPQASIFNHVQWEDQKRVGTHSTKRQTDSDAPRSTSLIFAHDQWEEPSNERRPRSRGDIDFFAAQQWDPSGGGRRAVRRRQNGVSGPTLFAKIQWDD